jgi:primosomal protein N' (replication factor Y)
MSRVILRVAVPSPVRRAFDYLAPRDVGAGQVLPGTRVRLPFGRTTRTGIVLGEVTHSAVEPQRLRPIGRLIDDTPVLPPDSVAFLQWAAGYYHHPLGEVFAAALPTLLRQGRPATVSGVRRWRLTHEGESADITSLARAPRQAALLAWLQHRGGPAAGPELEEVSSAWHQPMRALRSKGWVEPVDGPCLVPPPSVRAAPVSLSPAQATAVEAIGAAAGFQTFLLQGVTGSGKTEVYLQAVERVAAKGRQALVLIPEIGLTPQMIDRFRRRHGHSVSVLHSGLSDRERLCAWLLARDGEARIVIGTRSAVFVPLTDPGIIVVDEEHDVSYKQQDGFRYSARDLAVVRGQREQVPVVLGSATPSLESLRNLELGRYQRLMLPERVAGRPHPVVRLVDVRARPLSRGLSPALLASLAGVLARGQQALLFLNRRGYAPTLLCHDCGWVADCQRCDAHLVYHHATERLRCHHCGFERHSPPVCPECQGAELRRIGTGTERLEETLQDAFPKARIVRVDRDSMRRKGAMESVLERIHAGALDILIGTQMLAKGHHFPNVTLAGIVDADGGLFSADFRASERLAQLIVQVAGRAGRGDEPGEVLIQTHHPEHPLLRALVAADYDGFARRALEERRAAGLAPYQSMALLRAEAAAREVALAFLEQARDLAVPLAAADVELLGPVPAPMERRAGRSRAQLLVQSTSRTRLHGLLETWLPLLEDLKAVRRIRWSLDVDPQEMF